MELMNSTVASLVMADFNTTSPTSRNFSSLEVVPLRHLGITSQVVITVIYIVGVLGNLAALWFLFGSESKPRNPKHALMLRCLAVNDLVAILGMLTQMNMQLYLPALAHTKWFCRFRVLWRIFGLGSGCVAIVMAVERWFALARPFFYQRNVTVAIIRKSIFSLWVAVLIIVCLPFLGFGLYWESETATCVRYRQAKRPFDIAYAYLFLVFGTLLCVCIVWCNLAVMRVLCRSNPSSAKLKHPVTLPRRISRNQSLTFNACTREELAFARLMALLCIIFVICWMPQMVSIPMAQVDPSSKPNRIFFCMADGLMALHFTLNPFLYILQRWPYFRSLCWRNNNSRGSSVKTCYQLSSH